MGEAAEIVEALALREVRHGAGATSGDWFCGVCENEDDYSVDVEHRADCPWLRAKAWVEKRKGVLSK